MTIYYRNNRGLLELERDRALEAGEAPPDIPDDMPQGAYYTEAEVITLTNNAPREEWPTLGYGAVASQCVPDGYLTTEELAARQREAFKQSRAESVRRITVTTAAANTFDGDEESQTRMARAIVGLQIAPPGTTIPWVLADNSVIQATAAELGEALVLAGQAQAALWIQA